MGCACSNYDDDFGAKEASEKKSNIKRRGFTKFMIEKISQCRKSMTPDSEKEIPEIGTDCNELARNHRYKKLSDIGFVCPKNPGVVILDEPVFSAHERSDDEFVKNSVDAFKKTKQILHEAFCVNCESCRKA